MKCYKTSIPHTQIYIFLVQTKDSIWNSLRASKAHGKKKSHRYYFLSSDKTLVIKIWQAESRLHTNDLKKFLEKSRKENRQSKMGRLAFAKLRISIQPELSRLQAVYAEKLSALERQFFRINKRLPDKCLSEEYLRIMKTCQRLAHL